MKVKIFLDTNILFSYCSSPEIEMYSKFSSEFINEMHKRNLDYYITNSIKKEFDDKINEKIDLMINSIRDAIKCFKTEIKIEDYENPLLIYEKIFMKIRENITEANILNLIEIKCVQILKSDKTQTQHQIENTLIYLLSQSLSFKTEFERKLNSLKFKEIKQISNKYTELFDGIVHQKDKIHLSIIYENIMNKEKAIFVSVDNGILSKKREIESKFPEIQITSPLYVIEKLKRYM